MRFHFVGVANSVGSLLAFHLRRALPASDTITVIRGSSTGMRDFIAKNNGTITLEREGLRHRASGFLCEIPNSSQSPNPETRNMPEDTIDSLIVASRAFSTIPMLRMLRPRLKPSSTVVLLQSGLGIYEDVIKLIFPDPQTRPHFILASNSHRAYNHTLCHVVHTSIGDISFSAIPNDPSVESEAGFYDESLSPFERKGRLDDLMPRRDPHFESLRETTRALQEIGELNVSWISAADMHTVMRQRAAVRCVVDPLATLMNCRNGQLLMGPYGQGLAVRICNEASAIFTAERAAFNQTSKIPRQLQAQELRNDVEEYVLSTKKHISPMLADMRLGRPTEIKYLNGYLVTLGLRHGAPVSRNMTLMNLVNLRKAIPLDTFF